MEAVNFFAQKSIVNTLGLNKIEKLKTQITNTKRKKFEVTLELSKYVLNAYNWFKNEGKKAMESEGITMSAEEFALNVIGYKKAFYHKLVNVGKLVEESAEMVEDFISQCEQLEAKGESVAMSVEELLKFAKKSESAEGEGEGEGEGDEAKVEAKIPTILTLSFKASELDMGNNVSFRINGDGSMVTSNTQEEILQALAFIQLNYTK